MLHTRVIWARECWKEVVVRMEVQYSYYLKKLFMLLFGLLRLIPRVAAELSGKTTGSRVTIINETYDRGTHHTVRNTSCKARERPHIYMHLFILSRREERSIKESTNINNPRSCIVHLY